MATSSDTRVALSAAIGRVCQARGDSDADRAALVAECLALDTTGQADMLAHFKAEADRWQTTTHTKDANP